MPSASIQPLHRNPNGTPQNPDTHIALDRPGPRPLQGLVKVMVRIKRVYEEPAPSDGLRLLVDRLWPRGLSKERARVDRWLKEIAPSDELRRWFGHDPAKWQEFRSRYLQELAGQGPLLEELKAMARKGTVTLLFAAHDVERNNAVVLKEVLGK